MTKARWMMQAAVVLAMVSPVAATMAEVAAGEGEVRRELRVVVVDGESDVEVLEDLLTDAPGHRVIRLAGEEFQAGPGHIRFHGPIEGRGYLGVHLIDITPELRVHLGAGEDTGLLVARVEAGSPAEQAGLEVGDVLTHVGGEAVSSNWDVLRAVRPLTTGEGVALEVVRQGRVEMLSATVAEREHRQIEVHALLRRLGEDGETRAWEIDPAELGKRMGEVTEMFASPEWRDKVRTLTVTGEGLEQRLEQLESELERLAAHLEAQNRELEAQNRELEALEDDERE
ncbi:MAG TPA: PDZ domain-containing protein [Thermoanaerobaculia bacterium]|nr:PDZ domain-containing protein [Thermoanaerobaculia bacterium]